MVTNGFRFAGHNDWEDDSPLAMTNVNGGSEVSDFGWDSDSGFMSYTPGAININQELIDNYELATVLSLVALWSDATYTWLAFTATRDISSSTAEYSTNLAVSNWWPVSNETYEGSGGSYTQRFDLMTNSPVYYYEVRGTESP
jgi:hypothetical protein